MGSPQVRWLLKEGYAANEAEAVAIGNSIADLGLLEHVTKSHVFKNAHLFYRFTVAFGFTAPHDFDSSLLSRESEDSRVAR